MDKIKRSCLFRVMSLVLIFTFISLDISYAYPPEHNTQNSTLALPSVLQQTPINDNAARFQQSIFSQGALIASVYDIGEYFFGNADKGIGSLPSKYAEDATRADLKKHLSDAGTEIINIVPVEDIKTRTAPEKLKAALDAIGFNGTLPDEGVIFILYRRGNEKFLVQIARKGEVSAENLPGYEWVISDKYVVKYIPENYAGSVALPQSSSSVIASPSAKAQGEAISPLDVVKKSPKTGISGPIAQISPPEKITNDRKVITVRAIIRGLAILLFAALFSMPIPAKALAAGSRADAGTKPYVSEEEKRVDRLIEEALKESPPTTIPSIEPIVVPEFEIKPNSSLTDKEKGPLRANSGNLSKVIYFLANLLAIVGVAVVFFRYLMMPLFRYLSKTLFHVASLFAERRTNYLLHSYNVPRAINLMKRNLKVIKNIKTRFKELRTGSNKLKDIKLSLNSLLDEFENNVSKFYELSFLKEKLAAFQGEDSLQHQFLRFKALEATCNGRGDEIFPRGYQSLTLIFERISKFNEDQSNELANIKGALKSFDLDLLKHLLSLVVDKKNSIPTEILIETFENIRLVADFRKRGIDALFTMNDVKFWMLRSEDPALEEYNAAVLEGFGKVRFNEVDKSRMSQFLGGVANNSSLFTIYERQAAVTALRIIGGEEAEGLIAKALEDPLMLQREVRLPKNCSRDEAIKKIVDGMEWVIGHDTLVEQYPDIGKNVSHIFDKNPKILDFIKSYPLRLFSVRDRQKIDTVTLGDFRRY